MFLSVVVLAHHSLFADGLASSLAQYSDIFDVHLIDGVKADTQQKLRRLQPVIVVMDTLDTELMLALPAVQVLQILPNTKIIQINCNSDDVQIISSEQQRVSQFAELVAVLQHVGGRCSLTHPEVPYAS